MRQGFGCGERQQGRADAESEHGQRHDRQVFRARGAKRVGADRSCRHRELKLPPRQQQGTADHHHGGGDDRGLTHLIGGVRRLAINRPLAIGAATGAPLPARRLQRDIPLSKRIGDMHQMRRIYVHPLPIRIWHWLNAAGFIALILTGVQIRYVGLIDLFSFRTAVVLHNWIGFVLIANFFIWLGFYLFTDRIRVYHPELNPKKHFLAAVRQLQYYGYGIFTGAPNPFHVSIYAKFNPLQSMLYQIIMLMLVPIQFYTGVLLWDAHRFSAQIDLFGGIRVIDTVHVLIFAFFLSYIPIHAYLSALGHTPSAHYKAMFTGYEEVEEETGEFQGKAGAGQA
jgi:thiosulfate reductase cytochrome b subunit